MRSSFGCLRSPERKEHESKTDERKQAKDPRPEPRLTSRITDLELLLMA
jgi:hypothetical protein